MATNSSKWLVGCGIGCGVVILIGIILIGVGYLFVKDTVSGFKETEASMKAIEEIHGDVEDFCPEPDGMIPAERIEIFLAVRDSMEWVGEEMVETLGTLVQDIDEVERRDSPFWRILGIIRKGAGAIPQLAEYFNTRNERLLDEGMGLGEYYYIYVIGYYSWLGKSPSDGPDFPMMGGEEGRGYGWRVDDDEREAVEDVFEERGYRIRRRVRRMLLPMLRCQLEALQSDRSYRRMETWRLALEEEIEALEDDRDRLPWEDVLPAIIRDSLRPYRARLEASYNRLLNPLELQPD